MKQCIGILVCFLCIAALAPAKQVTCTVKVVDSNAKPVAGGEVAICEKFYDFQTSQEYSKQLTSNLRTNADGRCELTVDVCDLRSVFVVVRKEGLAIGWDCFNNTSFENARADFKIVLEQPCTLSGKIVDQNGKPVADTAVQAIPKTSYLSRLRQRPIIAPQDWFTVNTDNDGIFSFDNFAADVSSDFWVKAADRACVHKFTPYYQNSCGYEVGREGIKLVLPAEVPVTGRVVDAVSGKAVKGIGLLIRPSNIRDNINLYVPRQVVSGDEGKFRFDGVPTGEHLIKPLVSQESNKLIGNTQKFEVPPDRKPEDIKIELVKAGQLEIKVIEATTNEPLENITVSVFMEKSPPENSFNGMKKTNSEGIAIIAAPEGKCNVRAWGTGFARSTTQEAVTVTAGKKSVKQVLLDREPTLSGKVVDEAGKPVSGALVRVYPRGGEVITDVKGRFKASYEDERGAKMVYARHEGRNLAGIVIEVDEGKSVLITLKPAMKVTGRITDFDGKGIPAARCWLIISLPGTLSGTGVEVLTDSQGSYMFPAIAPFPKKKKSGYRLSAAAAGFGPEDYKKVTIIDKSKTSGELETVKLNAADMSVSGIVVDAEGKPAANVPIFLHGNGQPDKTTATDSNGNFVLDRICAGKLRIQANFSSSPGGSGRLETKGGDKNIKVVLGQEGVHVPYGSVAGNLLPQFDDIKIDFDREKEKGKNILVCFWDMQQRPSRHCIKELAKQAGQLKQKGVAVVLLQASKVDQKKLDEFVNKYNITFPVGMFEGSEKQIRLAWGVKSLPWLILTDKKHVVSSSGFLLSELDGKLK